jgi:hypothetical protein
MAMAAPMAAAILGASTAAAQMTTAAMVASIMDSAAAGIMNERASAMADQAKAALSIARKFHDLINAGI